MTRAFAGLAFLSAAGFSQTPGQALAQTPAAKPTFQIADVHASGPPGIHWGVFRAGRYEIPYATMLDLIQTAYSVDRDTVVGGPAWLDFDRFDVIAKTPPATSLATVRLMLQALLADRFKLVVHQETRPVQGFVLSEGKGKPKLKPADGSGERGCQPQPPQSPGRDRAIFCHNVTMDEFAFLLRQLGGGYFNQAVLNSTGLKGAWDFDLKWTSKGLLPSAGADGISVFDAVEKQLDLKLEPGKVAMPVLVVDSVNEKPTANSAEVKTALIPPPVAFEVASVRPSKPGAEEVGNLDQILPGGRFEAHGASLFGMIFGAWDLNPRWEVPGLPKWVTNDSPRFDIVAKAPAADAIDVGDGVRSFALDDVHGMMRALLAERFKMKAHYEDRPMDAYTLVAVKPKLKKAEAANPTGCKMTRGPRDPDAGPPPMIATCQNITMAQFAAQLQTMAGAYFRYPVLDASRIEGSWDFSLSFSPVPPDQVGGGGGNGGGKGAGKGGGAAASVSSDPSGAVSLFDALEKQLGLKLEKHQRREPVFVIDHIEAQPTDN
jgi:uncharacterized protein (TIGR03435 family)